MHRCCDPLCAAYRAIVSDSHCNRGELSKMVEAQNAQKDPESHHPIILHRKATCTNELRITLHQHECTITHMHANRCARTQGTTVHACSSVRACTSTGTYEDACTHTHAYTHSHACAHTRHFAGIKEQFIGLERFLPAVFCEIMAAAHVAVTPNPKAV